MILIYTQTNTLSDNPYPEYLKFRMRKLKICWFLILFQTFIPDI